MRVSSFARIGLFGMFAASLIAGSVGCSSLRQLPSKRFARQYTPPAPRPDVAAPAVEADAFTYGALDNLPTDVQLAAMRDHPDGGITHVQQVPSGTGPMLYRVFAVQEGVSTVTSYRSNGSNLSPRGSVVHADDSGRPKAKYAPQPEAGIPEKGTPSGTVD